MALSSVVAPLRKPTHLLARWALPIYALTIFLSALLLFAVEPMFTKMTLPALGGSPSVWSIAMVFFQGLMFAGYCYAHVLTKWMDPRKGVFVHAVVLLLACFSLPVALRAGVAPPTEHDPALWLIGVFTFSVGLPFFALSAQGPLLQYWFTHSGHEQADDPYFLYGASNFGSFAALLAYPLLIEPLIGLKAQSQMWTIGFVLLAGFIALSAASAFGGRSGVHALPEDIEVKTVEPVALPKALAWIGLAFVPSALLVSVTAHISTDIASAPLLWVIPLAIYLLTFVLTFRTPATVSDKVLAMAQPWMTAAVLMATCIGMYASMALSLGSHLLLFTVNALVCHTTLYRLRPDAQNLTLFYAAMSLGGALGGLFAGLAAPMLFSSVVEYPILLAAALFCLPGAFSQLRALSSTDWLKLVAMAALLPLASVASLPFVGPDYAFKGVAAGIGLAILLNWRHAGRTAVFGVAAVVSIFLLQTLSPSRETFRSFFGVHRVEEAREGQFRTLSHGTTIHGAIRIRNADGTPVTGRPLPATYYAPTGPLGEAVSAARAINGKLNHAAFIGLGVGALACHVQQNENATYYEIDPQVLKLAQDPKRFRFLSECTPQAKFVLGDARLTLAEQKEPSDIIVVDAFSSDAIPTHLLTREAFALYLNKLAPQGLIAVHISNNSMEFQGIVGRIATELGLVAYVRSDLAVGSDHPDFRAASKAVVLARDSAHVRALLGGSNAWHKIEPETKSWVWTDDYSTILSAIWTKLKE